MALTMASLLLLAPGVLLSIRAASASAESGRHLPTCRTSRGGFCEVLAGSTDFAGKIQIACDGVPHLGVALEFAVPYAYEPRCLVFVDDLTRASTFHAHASTTVFSVTLAEPGRRGEIEVFGYTCFEMPDTSTMMTGSPGGIQIGNARTSRAESPVIVTSDGVLTASELKLTAASVAVSTTLAVIVFLLFLGWIQHRIRTAIWLRRERAKKGVEGPYRDGGGTS